MPTLSVLQASVKPHAHKGWVCVCNTMNVLPIRTNKSSFHVASIVSCHGNAGATCFLQIPFWKQLQHTLFSVCTTVYGFLAFFVWPECSSSVQSQMLWNELSEWCKTRWRLMTKCQLCSQQRWPPPPKLRSDFRLHILVQLGHSYKLDEILVCTQGRVIIVLA